MIYRSKAPFRLGIAGGGTDLSPYCDIYGGAVLNVTINLYAKASIRPLNNGKIRFVHINDGIVEEFDSVSVIPESDPLILQKGVYNSIVKRYNNGIPLSFELTTQMDVPSGSGLGTSSTMVVAIIGAFNEWLKLPLGRYDIAHYAYEIERVDLKMAGGKQDQYAATFGGVNFMEFRDCDRVIVNPLDIPDDELQELAINTVLLYTNKQRQSAKIIEEQINNVNRKNAPSIDAMHRVKKEAFRIKDCLLKNELREVGKALNVSWTSKKKMASAISNGLIDSIYDEAMKAGAIGGKISGAGGGGFMFFYCPGNASYDVIKALEDMNVGTIYNFEFCKKGLDTWTAEE
ncbi:MAG: dehydrogenase [Bacteroidales bacterium]|nr:dehydrogenase [Bacteroidales bacterium]MCI2121491.1 dehydrogenase [Bacteroidales bacterium]MCI2145144.1 dehydrogenase [Bacteroidales bacterium]